MGYTKKLPSDPKPVDYEPREGQTQRGNRRTGAFKGAVGRNKSNFGKQMSWEDDPVIQERINMIRRLKAQGYTITQIHPKLDQWMKEQGLGGVSLRTVMRDQARSMEIQVVENEDARQEHLESLKLIKQEGWRGYESLPDASPTKVQYLNTLRANEETMAKVDGSLVHKTENIGANSNDGARILIMVLTKRYGEDEAMRVIDEITQEAERISRSTDS